jgi:hypothetical protein
MTREEFRTAVFARDGNKCIVPGCDLPAQDAHHIIERALWTEEGGYLVDNGASVCGLHHIHAEKNFIPPQALRNWAGIKKLVLPKQLDPAQLYNKWGEPVPRPNRYSIKYPHTPYLPFSPSVDQQDISDSGYMKTENLVGKSLVVTLKMDGSNCMWTSEKITARNGYDAPHRSFDLAKAEHAKVKHLIPSNIQIFGEWLFARHSIHYVNELALDQLFQLFGVYDRDQCLWISWAEVEDWAKRLGKITVPVVGFFTFDAKWQVEKELDKLGWKAVDSGHEGIVARSVYPYYWGNLGTNIAKFVRANHVTTDEHWQQQAIVRNEVKR